MKVLILMSTYNGEKYLDQQIDSILNQVGVDVELLIRDDGSSDSTISIIKKYSEKDKRVKIYTGNNLESARSFFDLVKHATYADYYAFSDQDDVWDSKKLYNAVHALEHYNSKIPLLYYCNMKVVDEQLNFLRMMHSARKRTDFRYSVLVEYYAAGCTMVFNNAALELCQNNMPEGEIMHDTWMEILCQFFGKVIYDPRPFIKYRQHGNNVIGVAISKKQQILNSLKRIIDKGKQPRLQYAKVIDDSIGDKLKRKDRNKVLEIVNYKKSLFTWLRLFCDNEIKGSSITDELRYKILLILKKI